MNNEKKAPVLTLEHLSPYLPYGLAIKIHDILGNYLKTEELSIDHLYKIRIWQLTPKLVPLSEYKDINSKSMNDLNTDLEIQIEICDLANKNIAFQSLSYGTAMECFSSHIDVFGLIEKGLAIDINSIEGKETNS